MLKQIGNAAAATWRRMMKPFHRHKSSSSSSSPVIKCTSSLGLIRMEGVTRYRLANSRGYYKVFVDAGKGISGAGYAAHIYGEDDRLCGCYKGRLEWRDDVIAVEMKALLRVGDLMAENYPDVRNVVLVTDCLQAYLHFVGSIRVTELQKHYKLYTEMAVHSRALQGHFGTFGFGRLPRTDLMMERVDGYGRAYLYKLGIIKLLYVKK